jgi:hypothetical protein
MAMPVAREPEYPSIDEFLDDLPPIENFLASEEEEVADEAQPATDDDWVLAGWKSYDFSSLSALAMRTPSAPVRAVQERAVRKTPDSTPSYSTSQPGPSADEIASALDGIARRIRSGELVIDHLHGIAPEAAMAAAIAALLRMRG